MIRQRRLFVLGCVATLIFSLYFLRFYITSTTKLSPKPNDGFLALIPHAAFSQHQPRQRIGEDTQQVLFGSENVTIASSMHLSSWLSLDTRRCRLGQIERVNFRYLDVLLICRKTSETCTVWYWDVANWTIIYSKTNMFTRSVGSMFCPLPINGLRTEKIIYDDDETEYPGCSIQKSPCTSWALWAPVFDNNMKQRINRSPCCRKGLIELTKYMVFVFDKYKITNFLIGGAVIGLVRDNGTYVPYDYDTDFAVDVKDYAKVVEALPELRKPGYYYEFSQKDKKGIPRYMVGCTNNKCDNGPGIGLYDIVEGDKIGVPFRTNLWPSLPMNITIPPIRRVFEGMEMYFPKDPEKYLDYAYGKGNWETPLMEFDP